MGPGVAGGAEREVGSAVGVAEIVSVPHGDGAVILRRRRAREEGAGLAIELAAIAARDVSPFSIGVRCEANLVGAAAIVKAIHLYGAVLLPEFGGEADVEEGVAFPWTGELDLKPVPAFDRARRRLCGQPRGQRREGAGDDGTSREFHGPSHLMVLGLRPCDVVP